MINPAQAAAGLQVLKSNGVSPKAPSPSTGGSSWYSAVTNSSPTKTPVSAPASPVMTPSNESFKGVSINNTDTSSAPTTDLTMKQVAVDTAKGAGNAAKSVVNGTVESGKDVAAAIGGSAYIDKLNKLTDGDQQFIKNMIELKNKNLASGNTATAQHFSDQLKNYKMTTGESATDVFPALAKSNEQVLGDFGSMALEAAGGGSLATSGAEKAAQVVDEGLPLAQRLVNGAKTGGKYGAAFGITGAMQNNASPVGIAEGAAGGAATGALLGGATEGALGKAPVNEAAAKATQEASDKATVDKAVGQIIQGDSKDIPAAKKALSSVDVSNVKTYKDLGSALNNRVQELSGKLDELLGTKPESIPMDKLEMSMKAGDQDVSHNYVKDALGQLKEFYTKTNDVKGLAEITQLEQKANEQGLSVKEVNDLARLHGQELNAFNANGELASGATKQAVENTRSGLKGTSRQQFGNPAAEAIDHELSQVIKTRDLIGDMANKVTALKQKIQERSLGAKVGNMVGKVINLMGLGTPKGIVEALIPRGQGFKVMKMNALDLEKALQPNLKTLQSLLDSDLSEKTIVSKLQEFMKPIGQTLLKSSEDIPNKEGGFVKNPLAGETKPNITPESVAKNMSGEDLQIARKVVHGNDLQAYMNSQPMMKAMGIDKLSMNDQIRFLRETIESSTKKVPVKK